MKLNKLLKKGYIRKWGFLIIDVLLILISIVFSFFVYYNFDTGVMMNSFFMGTILGTAGIYFITLLAVKPVREIELHINRNILKILFGAVLATIFLCILNMLLSSEKSMLIVPYAVLMINFFILFFLLCTSEVFFKRVFDTAFKTDTEPQSTDVFFVKRTLKDVKIEALLEREPIKMDNLKISATLRGKRILVTGAAGSIGSEIVRQVASFNPELIILCDIAESPLHDIGLQLEEKCKGIAHKLYISNITDASRMEYIFRNFAPHIVFHAAAYKHVFMMEENPREAVINNIKGTKTIADLAVSYGAERFVMVSTDKAVNPANIMGASKRIAEMYIQGLYQHSSNARDENQVINTKKTLFITTRFGNVLASNGSVIPRFTAQIEKGGPVTVTHPDVTRFFMTISEACQLVLEAGVMGKGGEIFVFDMGKSIRIEDLARNMITLAGLKPDEDIKILYTGLRPGEKLYEEVLSDAETTLPTYNEKIKIAQVQPTSYDYISNAVNNLEACANKGNDQELVNLMKEIVPEFISNNAAFNNIDKVLKTKTSISFTPVLDSFTFNK